MNDDIKFGDPPVLRTSRYDWDQIAETLKGRPDEWAEVFNQDRYSIVAAITNGAILAFADDGTGTFEVRTTNNRFVEQDDGKTRRLCDLWMRFVPTQTRPKRKRSN